MQAQGFLNLLRGNGEKKSRHALTSGAKETVPDVGPNGHSVFADAFLAALRNNYSTQTILDGHKLFDQITVQVADYQEKHRDYPKHTPMYDYIPKIGYEHGDFLFFPVDQSDRKNIRRELLATIEEQVPSNIQKVINRSDNSRNSSNRIQIVYTDSTLNLAQDIIKALNEAGFAAETKKFSLLAPVVRINIPDKHDRPNIKGNNLFFYGTGEIESRVAQVRNIVRPLLKGSELMNRPLSEERIATGLTIGIGEMMLILNEPQSFFGQLFNWSFD